METVNKLLIGLVALGFITCAFITYQMNKKEIISLSKNNSVDNITMKKHPYNNCIKLFIDQSNKQGVECNFDKAKSICFELIKSKGD